MAEFVEIESGRRAKRPKLDAALAACKKHKAKLVVAKLDRLSRDVAYIAEPETVSWHTRLVLGWDAATLVYLCLAWTIIGLSDDALRRLLLTPM